MDFINVNGNNYCVLFVRWSADWSSSVEELPKMAVSNTSNVSEIKMTIGTMIDADSGESRFNQHLLKWNINKSLIRR